MYAEGDTTELKTKCAVYLKDKLKEIVQLLKIDESRELDFNVLTHIFQKEITKFYRTKRMTKGLVPKDDDSQHSQLSDESDFEVLKQRDSLDMLEDSQEFKRPKKTEFVINQI